MAARLCREGTRAQHMCTGLHLRTDAVLPVAAPLSPASPPPFVQVVPELLDPKQLVSVIVSLAKWWVRRGCRRWLHRLHVLQQHLRASMAGVALPSRSYLACARPCVFLLAACACSS